MLLLAAATETGLLMQLEQALPPTPDPTQAPLSLPLASSPAVRRRLLLTLLFLSAVRIQRTWDLRGYTSDGLALLAGRKHAYSYHYTEAFLSQVARTDGAERFTDALAGFTTHLWHPTEEPAGTKCPHHLQALTCYIDGHRKPVYSDVLLPGGLIGRLSVVLGCRALPLLHDAQGHPLFVTTHRGDQHLTAGVPAFLERYEQRVGNSRVARMIVDRDGMATAFLARLHAEGRIVVTILQTNQYRDLSSFSDVGTFEPLTTSAHGQVLREVAPARISLPREEHPDEPLCVQVALIRDLRRTVEARPDPEEAEYPRRWDGDSPLPCNQPVVLLLRRRCSKYRESLMSSKIVITLFSLFAELERDLISLRTKEALAVKKQQGKTLGKPKGTIQKSKFDADLERIKDLLKLGLSARKIAALLGYNNHLALNTYIIKRRLREPGS